MTNEKFSPLTRLRRVAARTVSIVPGINVSTVIVHADLPDTVLTVNAPATALAGSTFTVTGSGLAAGEAYSISLGAGVVATGAASSSGTVTAAVTAYVFQPGGNVTVGLVGQGHGRAGSTTIGIIAGQFLETKRI